MFWDQVIFGIIFIILWSVSGIMVAGFVYGPFFYKHNYTEIRKRCYLLGMIGGPMISAVVAFRFYSEEWDTIGKVYWKSLL